MEATINDYVSWVFGHPKIRESARNLQYVCSLYLKDYTNSDNSHYNNAMAQISKIISISNPAVCRGFFETAIREFDEARKSQEDYEYLLSSLGLMYCYYRLRLIANVYSVQVDVSRSKYKGSFWDRYGADISQLGVALVTVFSAIAGCPTGPAAAMGSQTARAVGDDERKEVRYKEKAFNELRDAILSVKI